MVAFAYGLHAIIAICVFAQPIYQCNTFANIWGGGKPVDGGKTWRGKRIFGDHKTWRGIIAGLITGTLYGVVISIFFADPFHLGWFYGNVFPCNYPIYIGLLFSIGDHIADLLGSFIKRRINIAPGKGLFPWDQMGYILTGFAVAAPAMIPFGEYLWYYFVLLAGGTFFIHIFFTIIGYLIGLKKEWY